jgi:hypothetical protein
MLEHSPVPCFIPPPGSSFSSFLAGLSVSNVAPPDIDDQLNLILSNSLSALSNPSSSPASIIIALDNLSRCLSFRKDRALPQVLNPAFFNFLLGALTVDSLPNPAIQDCVIRVIHSALRAHPACREWLPSSFPTILIELLPSPSSAALIGYFLEDQGVFESLVNGGLTHELFAILGHLSMCPPAQVPLLELLLRLSGSLGFTDHDWMEFLTLLAKTLIPPETKKEESMVSQALYFRVLCAQPEVAVADMFLEHEARFIQYLVRHARVPALASTARQPLFAWLIKIAESSVERAGALLDRGVAEYLVEGPFGAWPEHHPDKLRPLAWRTAGAIARSDELAVRLMIPGMRAMLEEHLTGQAIIVMEAVLSLVYRLIALVSDDSLLQWLGEHAEEIGEAMAAIFDADQKVITARTIEIVRFVLDKCAADGGCHMLYQKIAGIFTSGSGREAIEKTAAGGETELRTAAQALLEMLVE